MGTKILKTIPALATLVFLILIVFCVPITAKASLTATTNTASTASPSSAGCAKPTDIGTLFDYGRCIISSGVIPLIIGIGLMLFLIGVVQYISSGDNEEKREAGRNLMIYGIISIFVMVSVWGFVNILISTFNFTNSTPTMPALPPSQNNT